MKAENRERRRRQKEAPLKVEGQFAEPEDANAISGGGFFDDNSEEMKSQFWDEESGGGSGGDKWDELVEKYVAESSSRVNGGREPVVHDSGWRKKNGRRMRLVLVEGERMPMQRQWVLDIMKRALWEG